jgi:hypothetical protein
MGVLTRTQCGILCRPPNRYRDSDYPSPTKATKASPKQTKKTPNEAQTKSKLKPISKLRKSSCKVKPHYPKYSPPDQRSRVLVRQSKRPTRPPHTKTKNRRLFNGNVESTQPDITHRTKSFGETELTLRNVDVAKTSLNADGSFPFITEQETLADGHSIVQLGPITTRKVNLRGGRSVTYILTARGWDFMKREG